MDLGVRVTDDQRIRVLVDPSVGIAVDPGVGIAEAQAVDILFRYRVETAGVRVAGDDGPPP